MQPVYAALACKKKAEGLIIQSLHAETGLSAKRASFLMGVGTSMYTAAINPDRVTTVTLDGLFIIKYHLQNFIGNQNGSSSK